MAATTQSIVRALGGTHVFRRQVRGLEDLLARVRAGLPFAAVDEVGERFGLDRDDLQALLRLSTSPSSQGLLGAEESDRLVRLARIAALASDVLGDDARASRWLQRPNRALSGRLPLSLLDTDLGAREVETVLGRIEFGVYS